MPDPEGTKKHPDNKDVEQNKPPNREIKPLNVSRSHEKRKGELEQGQQASKTDQRQHPGDSSQGKSGDPFDLTGHFADMLKKSGTLTDGITRQLGEVTQKLERVQESKSDAGDTTKRQHLSPEQRKMQDRKISSINLFEAYTKKAGISLDNALLRNIFLR